MEARRKAEEAERLKQEERDRAAALALQRQLRDAARADQDNRDRCVLLNLTVHRWLQGRRQLAAA